jgi:hypothetical protein
MFQTIADDNWNPAYLHDLDTMPFELYRVASELENTPLGRISWFEDRVVVMKTIEEFIRVRVADGNEHPHMLPLVRFRRLKAEAELLKLKEEIESAENREMSGKNVPTNRDGANPMALFTDDPKGPPKKIPPTYSAFPNLKSTIDPKQESPLMTVPDVVRAADGSLLQKIELAQVQEGAEHLRIFNQIFPVLSQHPKFYIDNVVAGVATHRAAAGLEVSPASRARLYEVLVLTLKGTERYVERQIHTVMRHCSI